MKYLKIFEDYHKDLVSLYTIMTHEDISEPIPQEVEDDEDEDAIDDYLYTHRKKVRYILYAKEELDQHTLAYEIFRNAKYVNVINMKPAGKGFVYEIQVTNQSREDQEMEDRGENDYDDY